MIIDTDQDMMSFGERIAEALELPMTIELIGDVGVGKTTFVKGLARGLGIEGEVNSPSFTLSKAYFAPEKNVVLRHYDFYRLADPGIMAEELFESVNEIGTVTVVEWGESVGDVLPERRMKIRIKYLENGSREAEVEE